MRKIITKIVLLLLGVGFSVWGWGLIANARLSLSWPTTTGTVVHSEVTSHDSRSDGKTTRMYSADVHYRYTVNGGQYSSDRVTLGDSSTSSAGGKQEIVGRYPAGARVMVYYDPDYPQSALLEAGPVFITYLPFAFGLLAIAAGVAAFFWRSRPMPPPGSRRSGLSRE